MAAALRALMGASFVLGGCSGSSSDGPVQPGGGGAVKLAFTVQPSNAVAGAAIAPAVQVAIEDAQGNTVTTASNGITLAIGTNPANGTLSGTTTVAAVNGVASFSTLGMDKTGTGYTLTASATGLTGAASSAFNVSAGPAAKLVFTVQPSNAVAGSAIAPAVQVAVQDAQGNSVTTATTSITLAIGTNPANGTLSGATTVNAVAGVATFSNVSLNSIGTGFTLTASAGGLTVATSNAFNVVAGAAAKLAFIVQPSNAMIPAVQVAVQDAQGNTVATAANSVTLAIETNPANGTLSGTTTVSAVNGVATFRDLSIDNLGNGYTLAARSTSLVGATSSSFNITGLMLATLSVGVSHSCGVTSTGAAFCWGDNGWGERGSGTTVGGPTPAPVSGGLTFASVSAGEGTSCGITTGGAAYCWGYNAYGELGNGGTGYRTTPVAVSGGLAFESVSVGEGGFTCGVTTAHAAYCWGFNNWGQLGDGASGAAASSTVPVAVSGGLAFAHLSAAGDSYGLGTGFVCGVTTAGAAYCWGSNHYGELGDGTGTSRSTPGAVSGGLTFSVVSAGNGFACGLTPAGKAYCWGGNSNGWALGNGTTASSTTPVAVAGGLTFSSVSAGGFGACGVTTAHIAYCWGNNSTGALGTGSFVSSTIPVPVSGGLLWTELSAGWANTCGITTAGAAYCWGENNYWQLGNGTMIRSTTPGVVW